MISQLNKFFIPPISNIIFDYINPSKYLYNIVLMELKQKSNNYCYSCYINFTEIKKPIFYHYICCCKENYCIDCFKNHQNSCNHLGYMLQYLVNDEISFS
jgi:hypothetical protein